MSSKRSLRFLPKFGLVTCNVMFTLFIFGSIYLLADNGIDPAPVEQAAAAVDSARPWLSLAILVPAILGIAFLLTIGSEIDRRCAEDYVYQIVANAALIAVTTTLMAFVFWNFGAGLNFGLRQPHSDDFVGLLLLSWATGWFTIRMRGLTA